ncbi:MAG: hypothetical protein ACJ8FY_17860 [Gemmataceae bacterium]
MRRLAISLLITVALATISQARPPLFSRSSETIVTEGASSPAPPLAGSTDNPGVAQSGQIQQVGQVENSEACGADGCGKGHLFHHHCRTHCGHFSGKHLSWFHGLGFGGHGGGHGGNGAAGDAAFPTHPYARSPRDFFMME